MHHVIHHPPNNHKNQSVQKVCTLRQWWCKTVTATTAKKNLSRQALTNTVHAYVAVQVPRTHASETHFPSADRNNYCWSLPGPKSLSMKYIYLQFHHAGNRRHVKLWLSWRLIQSGQNRKQERSLPFTQAADISENRKNLTAMRGGSKRGSTWML